MIKIGDVYKMETTLSSSGPHEWMMQKTGLREILVKVVKITDGVAYLSIDFQVLNGKINNGMQFSVGWNKKTNTYANPTYYKFTLHNSIVPTLWDI